MALYERTVWVFGKEALLGSFAKVNSDVVESKIPCCRTHRCRASEQFQHYGSAPSPFSLMTKISCSQNLLMQQVWYVALGVRALWSPIVGTTDYLLVTVSWSQRPIL